MLLNLLLGSGAAFYSLIGSMINNLSIVFIIISTILIICYLIAWLLFFDKLKSEIKPWSSITHL